MTRKRIAFLGALTAAVVGSVVAVILMRPSEFDKMKACQKNLTMIDGAKEQFALSSSVRPDDNPTKEMLASPDGKGYLAEWPQCPNGGEYIIGSIGTDPQCTSGLEGHWLEAVGFE